MVKGNSFSRFLIWASMGILLGFMVLVMIKDLTVNTLVTTMVSGVVATIGVWLGMDMRAVINLTASCPPGEYVAAESGKYIMAMIGLFFLFVLGLVMEFLTTTSYEIPVAILAGGFFAIVMVYVGGTKAVKNKMGISEPIRQAAGFGNGEI